MSLDVYLKVDEPVKKRTGSGIFIRKDGMTKEISREKWDEMNPGCEPVARKGDESPTHCIFSANITHNLNVMADAAGIYKEVWRPEENGITYAHQLIEPLERGITWLAIHREKAKKLEPDNGWGTYEGFLLWLQDYLQACRENPDTRVDVSR